MTPMRNYKLSKMGKAEIISYEAIILTPYIDSGGVKTVGIGATVSDIPDIKSWSWDKEISITQAVDMFLRHVDKYAAAVNKALKVDVTQEQFDALVSITYNIGTGGMAGSTFMRRVNEKAAPDRVAAAMLMWNKDNGKTIPGLTTRRRKEGALYASGVYSSGGKALIAPTNSAHKPVYRLGKEINILDYL